MNHEVFVFGSNTAGVHGAGAAAVAVERYGAQMGKGIGHYGQSYAIPTKSLRLQTLQLSVIKAHVGVFIEFAKSHPALNFKVTQIGCGLAGLRPRDIAPMFMEAPANCFFDSAWEPWLGERKYWGTYS